jgi:preprotein translocase subunit SecG
MFMRFAFSLSLRSVFEGKHRVRLGQRGLKNILYRTARLAGVLGLVLCLVLSVLAQEPQDVPQIVPYGKRAAKKPDSGPRALALLQLAPNGKATLIPIVIRIDKRFYDAASYKANPVPMALEPGTVYEAERSGSSLGLFTVGAALHSSAVNAISPWIATGSWLPEGSEAPKTALKAENVPVGIESSDAPPRLSRGDNSKGTSSAGTTAPPPSPKTAPETPSPGSQPSGPTPTPPAQSKPPQQSPPTNSESTDSTNSHADEGNRPRLRRGRPTQPLPSDEDIPGYSRPGENTTAKSTGPATSAAPAPPEGTQLIPAISDADGPDPHSYAFEWGKGEEEDRQKQMLELARAEFSKYLNAQAKDTIPAHPAGPGGAVRTRTKTLKTPELVFENVQMRTFDLWGNNQPVLILSAEAHPPTPSVAHTTGSNEVTHYMITLVARTDIYSSLHRIYTGITDKYHLDVTSRLELVDAVDADGDGRGELLFRETSDVGSGYVIYRATADTLWKMFDSLNQE